MKSSKMKYVKTLIIIMFIVVALLANLTLSSEKMFVKTSIISIPASPDPTNSRARHAKLNIKAYVKNVFIESDMTGRERAYYILRLFGYEIFTKDWGEGINLKDISLGSLITLIKNVGGLSGKPEVEVKVKMDVFVQLLKLKNRLKANSLNSVLRHLIEEHELYHKLKRGKLCAF